MNGLSDTIKRMEVEIRDRAIASNRRMAEYEARNYDRSIDLGYHTNRLYRIAAGYPPHPLVLRDEQGEGSTLTKDILNFYLRAWRRRSDLVGGIRTPLRAVILRGSIIAEIRILRAQRRKESTHLLAAE